MFDEVSAIGLTPKPIKTADGFTYDASALHAARYVVKYVYTRADFKAALETPNVHLIYSGHSRGGLGPCFLDKDTPQGPGETWGDGGVYKMGFDFCGTPTFVVQEHQYAAHPVPIGTSVDPNKSEPAYLRPYVSTLTPKITGAPPALPNAQYQTFSAPNAESATDITTPVEWLAVSAGSADFIATTPRARVFCMFSCNTANSFKAIVSARAWLGGDSGFVYYTSDVNAPFDTTKAWLQNLFRFKAPGCSAWKPSLDYAMDQSNPTLSAKGSAAIYPNHKALEKGWIIVQ